MSHLVEFIPVEWLERSCWAAVCSERLQVYSRPIQIERRSQTERRRSSEPIQSFQSLNLAELGLV
jgi:hypothetical protein